MSNEFCGGAKDSGGCRGDSGGPIVTASSAKDVMKGKAQVVGMLTYGVDCGGSNIYLDFSNKKLSKWIKKNAK